MLAWNGGRRRRVSGRGASSSSSASSLQCAFFASQHHGSAPTQHGSAQVLTSSSQAAARLLVLGAEAAAADQGQVVCELDKPLRGLKSKADRSRISSRSVGGAAGGAIDEASVLPPGDTKRRRSSGDGLPAGWVATVSRNTGKTYYRHKTSNKTS